MRHLKNQIGNRGELIAALALSRPVIGRYRRPLFEPTYLGAKYPAADFLVDVLGRTGKSDGFFFVQVKATTRPAGSDRLYVMADPTAIARLARIPVPMYLVGVDLTTERTYVAAVFGRRGRTWVRGLTTRFPLADEAVRIGLYREVTDYWSARGRRPTETRFGDV